MAEGLIRPLSKEVIGQIAAGEVVERPASAVKELVENSIDAGATAVTVEIRDGGITFLRVADNGCGIRPEDILMAFARHATSKISQARDLYGVRSLGFRGEALASIAAVAKVTCRTRLRDRELGIEAVNEGGVMQSVRDCACPEGTAFLVRDLFFNTPVRRKFLKKPASEGALVAELMQRFILCRPDISFRFTADGKNVYFSPGDGNLEHAAMAVFPTAALRQMTRVQGTQSGVRLSGLVGTGDASRGNRSQEFFFLNGRATRSAMLSAAVEDACRQLVTIGRFPVCALHLEVPYESVDVNVHPNKWEVRFADEAAVRDAVRDLVTDALNRERRSEDRIPPVFPDTAAPRESTPQITKTEVLPPQESTPPEQRGPAAPPPSSLFTAPVVLREETAPAPAAVPKEAVKEPEQLQLKEAAARYDQPHARILGVLFRTYILIEYDRSLLLCDQHAVHERLLYEKLMREAGGRPPIQALLVPLTLTLSPGEWEGFLENRQALYEAGFDAEEFGDRTVRLKGLPLILGTPQAEKCFHEALDDLNVHGEITQLERVQRITQMACKHAVKGGEPLTPDTVQELVERALRDDIRLTCPHGRPLMIRLTQEDIEKRFKRIQS